MYTFAIFELIVAEIYMYSDFKNSTSAKILQIGDVTQNIGEFMTHHGHIHLMV